jgi:type IV pilus assembly protein PilV
MLNKKVKLQFNQVNGFFLLEALIAVLIFSLGLLGLVAMNAAAITAQSDAQYRAEAAKFTNEIIGEMWVGVNRTSPATVAASLAAFTHQAGSANCPFSGTASTNPQVLTWQSKILANAGLPGSTSTMQQILVDTNATTGFNKVTVTICWQTPQDSNMRRHISVSYIN